MSATERETYQELRLALVFNGGVSLAVWMGGVAKELDRFRCALRRTPEAMRADPSLGYYAELLDALRCEVVTDVIAGTSAGGINGAMLGYVVGNRKSLEVAGPDAIRDTWQKLGAIDDLLKVGSDPASALSGDELFEGCAEVFDRLRASPSDLSGNAACQVALTVTATDCRGFEVGEATGNTAIDHRLEMSFGHQERPSAADMRMPAEVLDAVATLPGASATGWPLPPVDGRGLLADGDAPAMLARAARSTASFPFAFAPSDLPLDAASPALDGRSPLTATPAMRAVVGTRSGTVTLEGPMREAIDGGVWDNAPFEAVLAGIGAMGARREVDRQLVYIVATNRISHAPTSPAAEPRGAGAKGLGKLVDPLRHSLTTPSNVAFANDLERIAVDIAQQRTRRAGLAALLADEPPDIFVLARELFGRYRERVSHEKEVVPPAGLSLDSQASLEAWGATAEDWQWGVRPVRLALEAARRVTRGLLATADGEARATLIDARETLSQLSLLLDDLEALPSDPAHRRVYGAVMHAVAATVAAARPQLERMSESGRADRTMQVALGLSAGERELIVKRALATEVANHALSADQRPYKVDYGFQTIRPDLDPAIAHVAYQCNPGNPPQRPALCGEAYGHFGGFLRASWRLSDWMWGRLDGTSHMLCLLLVPDRIHRVTRGERERAQELAQALAKIAIPDPEPAAPDRSRSLAHEAYRTRNLLDDPSAPSDTGDEARITDWRARLTREYAEELLGGGDLDALRADLLRPVQRAIVDHELPAILEALRHEPSPGSLPTMTELRARPDGGLSAVSSAMHAQVPEPELVGLGERVATNLLRATGHDRASKFLARVTAETERHRWLGRVTAAVIAVIARLRRRRRRG